MNSNVELEERLQFVTVVADLSAKFIGIPAGKIDHEINGSLQQVCDCLGLDVGVLWQWELGMPATFVVTHFYRPLGGPPVPERLDAAVYFPWSLRQAQQGKMFAVPSTERTPADAEVDRQFWRHFGIKSVLSFPLAVGGGSPFGVLTLCMMRAERAWPEPLVEQLAFIAQVFASALVRKRDEQALQESEMRLSLAADSAGVGLWSLDLASNQFWLTPKVREFFKFTADESVTWQRFLEVIDPEDREIVERVLQEVVRTEKEGKVEFRIPQPDGSARWLLSRGRLRKDVPSALRRVMGVTLDITERKRSEEKVRQSSHALEQSPVSVVITDLQGIIVYVNRKFCEVSGYSFAESVGQNPRILKSGKSSTEMYQELWTTISSGKAWRGEFHNRKKNGELFWESAVISPLFDEAGRITHFVGVKEDITERKKVEAALRKTELERAEQRSQLAHLSRVNMLGALSGSLAHELNQPLGIILSNAQAAQELLAQEPPDLAEAQAILTDIVAADRRAGDVIERLRALLKHGQASLQPVQLNRIIEEVLNLARADLIGRGIAVVCALAPDLPSIAGDRVQLQQLVLNLILNAAEAMAGNDPATRRIHIQTMLQEGRVRASVRDEGAGLPGDVERIFQPFYTNKPQGLGMGLAICRSIINAHHGQLWAEPHSERGAVFFFDLPIAGSAVKP